MSGTEIAHGAPLQMQMSGWKSWCSTESRGGQATSKMSRPLRAGPASVTASKHSRSTITCCRQAPVGYCLRAQLA
eukprot:3224043-Rhodomonas_salina.1